MNQETQSYVMLTEHNFKTEVLENKKPVLVDFWAPWCDPCQALGPVIGEIADEFQSRAVVGKLNVDDHPDLASKCGIQSIPTLMIFQNGDIDQMVGNIPKATLTQKLETQLQPA